MKIAFEVTFIDKFRVAFNNIKSFLYRNDYSIEFYIASGYSKKDILRILRNNSIKNDIFSDIYSIQDDLDLNNSENSIGVNYAGRKEYPNDLWNSKKGDFCNSNNIDLIFDDNIENRKYFQKTKQLLLKKADTEFEIYAKFFRWFFTSKIKN